MNHLDVLLAWPEAGWIDAGPDSRVDAPLSTKVSPTGQTTLIGHLTLEEYASLAEVANVIEMYVTEGTLMVRFVGGAWPGSVLSVFETSFPL